MVALAGEGERRAGGIVLSESHSHVDIDSKSHASWNHGLMVLGPGAGRPGLLSGHVGRDMKSAALLVVVS
ncbi:hypothetical protein SARC_03686 [Sphaeroforma arctica JP610]|uniref:Uncharacterized protein n=1 Tax=Sphaeroforma arctica JP610 TaxID=667725 RepID=A0A0L0G7B2_9EUKA|nr:hypothetical protein SARC_03686 [Sphaeroforma arctica JP610]KNC84093.1 hypothetical protein SARC_03686 [Sphaeroforma arctica JP610]|eukprot:XP_014157995.1 hypothetical protein SARC_03686 [Sphaeroforma arctica JP610]